MEDECGEGQSSQVNGFVVPSWEAATAKRLAAIAATRERPLLRPDMVVDDGMSGAVVLHWKRVAALYISCGIGMVIVEHRPHLHVNRNFDDW